MKKMLIFLSISALMASCVGEDEKVHEDMKILKEDVSQLKEELKKLREDNEKLIKDAVSAEVKKDDALEGSAN